MPTDPHAGQPTLRAGPEPERAAGTLALLHGRGATAQSMLSLYYALDVEELAAVAPQAAGNTWYPYSFLAPLETNQPYLDSALRRLDAIVSDLLSRGVRSERIAILGFSQGACLTAEFVARHPRRYGAVMCLTGGLIGPPGRTWEYPGMAAEAPAFEAPRAGQARRLNESAGALAGTPVFLGASDPDAHVPFERVLETEAVLDRMGAKVEVRRYVDMPHTINEDELDACRALLRAMVSGE